MQASPGGASVRACLLDNRGVGRSGSPKARQAYTTTIMADDCIAVLVCHSTFCISIRIVTENEPETEIQHNTDSDVQKLVTATCPIYILMTPRSRSANMDMHFAFQGSTCKTPGLVCSQNSLDLLSCTVCMKGWKLF